MNQSIPLCQLIECPFWSGNHQRSYGCQRYSSARDCHLTVAHSHLRHTEYALYGDEVKGVKEENDRFFLEDSCYAIEQAVNRMENDRPQPQP